jgi:hypothetical protein
VYYAGGGSGGSNYLWTTGGIGGLGGGGNIGLNGTVNTGGGGGGEEFGDAIVGSGGSGIVIVRYSDTEPAATTTGSPTVTVTGGYRIYQFTSSGTITFN